MKKLINQVENVITEQLEGMGLAHPELIRVSLEPRYICRADAPVRGKVAIVSGGGSGHEPMHGGLVGRGMLDGACPGEVFTSPTPDQMYECARAVDGGAGVLFIVKNYTGDVLNFETAAEMVHAEGLKVETILIDDDVAVRDSLFTAGRRGLGTTVLAEKIVGAAAEAGYDLRYCANLCRKVNVSGRSIGVALTSCTVPAVGRPTFDLAEDEIELGIGIHGEPGTERTKLKPVDEIVDEMVARIVEDGPYSRDVREWDNDRGQWSDRELISEPFKAGDEVIALVNSMGGTPVSELYAVYRRTALACAALGLRIVRNVVGAYITALDMQGCSLSLLRVDDEMLRFWDAPVWTPAMRKGV